LLIEKFINNPRHIEIQVRIYKYLFLYLRISVLSSQHPQHDGKVTTAASNTTTLYNNISQKEMNSQTLMGGRPSHSVYNGKPDVFTSDIQRAYTFRSVAIKSKLAQNRNFFSHKGDKIPF
jgi:hypothetical protein